MDSQGMSSGSSAPLHEFSGSLSLGAAGWCCRWTQHLPLWLLVLCFLIISVTHFRKLSRLLQCLACTIRTMLLLARILSVPCLFAKVCQVILWMIPVCYGDIYGHLKKIVPFSWCLYYTLFVDSLICGESYSLLPRSQQTWPPSDSSKHNSSGAGQHPPCSWHLRKSKTRCLGRKWELMDESDQWPEWANQETSWG